MLERCDRRVEENATIEALASGANRQASTRAEFLRSFMWDGDDRVIRSISTPLLPHGGTSSLALLLIDVINPMDFEGGDDLLPQAIEAAKHIAWLTQQARQAGVPVIYVNDNFDCWHLGFRELVDRLRTERVPGLPLIDLLAPEPARDFYVLKPNHSGFFRTGLEVLLRRLNVSTLIVTGFAGDICVLFTANDAYMRGFEIIVPPDCIASQRTADNEHALSQMRRLLKADVIASMDLKLQTLR